MNYIFSHSDNHSIVSKETSGRIYMHMRNSSSENGIFGNCSQTSNIIMTNEYTTYTLYSSNSAPRHTHNRWLVQDIILQLFMVYTIHLLVTAAGTSSATPSSKRGSCRTEQLVLFWLRLPAAVTSSLPYICIHEVSAV